jgi:ribosomal protein S18 acetylase RimI-like enzyme
MITPLTYASPMRIRAAREADAAAIASIHVRGWRAAYEGLMPDAYLDGLDPEEWGLRHRGRILVPEPGMTRLVAENAEGTITGFAVLGPAREPMPDPHAGEVYAIYVEPGDLRRGTGRALLDSATRILAEQGHTVASLWVLRDNAPARRFYEALGWRFDGAEKGFELPGFEDVEIPEVRYVRPLLPSSRLD